MPENHPLSFEDTLAELEALVDTLEHGDLPLDDPLNRLDVTMAKTANATLTPTETRKQHPENNYSHD